MVWSSRCRFEVEVSRASKNRLPLNELTISNSAFSVFRAHRRTFARETSTSCSSVTPCGCGPRRVSRETASAAVELGAHRAPRCEPVVSLVRSRRAPTCPLIVLPKSCSCRCGDPVLLPHPSFACLFSFFLLSCERRILRSFYTYLARGKYFSGLGAHHWH